MDDGAFVGADGVRAGFQGGLEMFDGGLAGAPIQRASLEKHVCARGGEPFADVGGLLRGLRRPAMGEGGGRVEAVRVGDPTDPSRGDACKFPGDAVITLKYGVFCEQQADEFLADVSEANEREAVSSNKKFLLQSGSGYTELRHP